MPRFKKDDGIAFNYTLTFDNKEQYDLFKSYLKQTKITRMRDEPEDINRSLEDYYLEKYEETQLEATLHQKCGIKSLVSKFMKETRMMEMDYTEFMVDYYSYEHDANSDFLPLDRQGEATIDSAVLQRMQQYRQNQEKTIIQTLSQYEAHLRQKLISEGLLVLQKLKSEGQLADVMIRVDALTTTKQQKLLTRYKAIRAVYNDIKDNSPLNKEEYKKVKDAVITCQENKPAWSERAFLQKLTDIFSLGFKPLYRFFFSKEAQLEEKLQESSPPTLLSLE